MSFVALGLGADDCTVKKKNLLKIDMVKLGSRINKFSQLFPDLQEVVTLLFVGYLV